MGIKEVDKVLRRDPAIELWRCFCMFAVVFGHVLVNNKVMPMDAFVWHIPGFLIITGYFGITLKWRKVINLILTCYLCYWLTIPFREIPPNFINLLLPHGGWFVPFYIVLILLSPLLNAAVENSAHHKTIFMSMAILVFASWIPLLTHGPHASMMRIEGMQGSGIMLMIVIYVVARLFSLHFKSVKFRHGALIAAGVAVLLNVFAVLLYRRLQSGAVYLSPFSLVIAFCGFFAFKDIKLKVWVQKVVLLISPSMFGVYLLHECCVRKYQYSEFAARSVWHALLWSVALFIGCVGIDLVRRMLLKTLEVVMAKLKATRHV